MNSKIELINEYIERCEKCSQENARQLVHEIIAVYENEIKGITTNLDSYSWGHKNLTEIDYLSDTKFLKAHLINHKANLENNLRFTEGTPSQIFNINQSQNAEISISITFEQTISAIEAIPDETLSQDEKELLEGKLTKISTEKDKSKLWEKAQSALKWIADKGIEVGIAALPYIAEALKNAK